MKLIVAVDENWGIGKNNNLLFDMPKDMRFFHEMTMNKVVILGRKSLQSFPNQKPLKNRTNIILTRNTSFKCNNAIVCNNISDIFKLPYKRNDMFVIGGEEIYKQLLRYCNICYVTKVFEAVSADKYMVNLDMHNDWEKVDESDVQNDNGHIIQFCTYERTNNYIIY